MMAEYAQRDEITDTERMNEVEFVGYSWTISGTSSLKSEFGVDKKGQSNSRQAYKIWKLNRLKLHTKD